MEKGLIFVVPPPISAAVFQLSYCSQGSSGSSILRGIWGLLQEKGKREIHARLMEMPSAHGSV